MQTPLVFLSGSDYTGSGPWVDKSGNGNNATIATGSIGKTSNSIVFDGTTHWTIPNVGLGNAWTLNIWYKKTSPSPDCDILAQAREAGPIQFVVGGNTIGNGEDIAAGFYDQDYGWALGIPYKLIQGEWTNIQVVWNGSSVTTYINSTLLGSVPTNNSPTDNGNLYRIGSRWDAGTFVTGEVGEIRIYNAALTQAKVTADYNESLPTFREAAPSAKPLCFLADAPVLTSNGYVRIDSVQVGDSLITPKGDFKVTKLFCETYSAGPDTNPYIIPDGRFGAIGNLRISPRHRVYANGRMIEARDLCLEQEDWLGPVTYYNLEIEGGHNILVSGVEVESLIPVSLYRIPGDIFQHVLKSKYNGIMTPEIKNSCRLFEDGSVAVHAVAR
jgi:hypothetical protein